MSARTSAFCSPSQAVHRGAVFLRRGQRARPEAVRGGEHHRVRRRTQADVEAVDLDAHRAADAHAVVADALALFDAFHCKGHARVGRVGRQQVVARVVIHHGRKTHADELLRRKAAVAPQRAGLAGAGQVDLAGARLPGARAGHAAPHLDGGGRLRVEGAAPVEAVGAQRQVAPAGVLVGHDAVHHGFAVVLGVRQRGQHRVARERAHALAVELHVGDQVVRNALLLQPVDEVRVDGQVAGLRARAHVEHRAQPRAVGAAAAVHVMVVGGLAQLGVLLQVDVVAREHQQPLGQHLEVDRVQAQRAVGVGHVGHGGREHGQLRARRIGRRRDEEADVGLGVLRDLRVGGPQAQRMEARAPAARHVELQRGGPAAVVDVVAVEVDCAVLARRQPPVVHVAGPVHAGHAAARQLLQRAVQAVGRSVGHLEGVDAVAEVPAGDEARIGQARARGVVGAAQRLGPRQAGHDARRLDLAVDSAPWCAAWQATRGARPR
jgi:hypothetical protein